MFYFYNQIRKPLLLIFLLGIITRFLFIWIGADIYFGGGNKFVNGDTPSYIQSFVNLAETGHYTFDPTIPEASFGRLPGFPFFYGIHYYIFGEKYSFIATAISQTLLDSFAIILVSLIIFKLTKSKLPSLVGASIYAIYPFTIVWSTVMGSELLSNFFIILYFYVLITCQRKPYYYIFLGLLVCLAFYTREFLGIFFPITVFYFIITERKLGFNRLIKSTTLFTLAFTLLYLPWPIRNIVNHQKFILVKPAAAGYPNLAPDALSYLKFVDSWSVENLRWFEEMKHNERIPFPDEVFATSKDRILADSLVLLSRRCGTGFYIRKHGIKWPYPENCNQEISEGFSYLQASYRKNNPLDYWLKVPAKKLMKAVFKSQTLNSPQTGIRTLLISILFKFRTLLILLGVSGLILFRNRLELLVISLYAFFIYFFICFIFRSVEIRYFLQADTLLIIPASLIISRLFKSGNKSQKII